MKNNLKKSFFAALIVLGTATQTQGQAVIFPQAEQPGVAVATQNGDSYVLSNDLFTATFTKENETLIFSGSDALHLLGGTELFKITLGDGTEVPASAMTLGTVAIESLTGDADAVKGSHRFDGQQLVANYTYGNLTIVWRAVLRDGSHYLRTELDITASSDQAMTNIIPMIYNVDTSDGDAPVVVGNTRGAVLASNTIFAGLETPMGINTAGISSSETATQIYTENYSCWSSFSNTTSVPEGVSMDGISTYKLRTKSDVSLSTGTYTVTFDYTSGNHRLNMLGVDVIDNNGNVVAYDYHYGYTGGSDSQNTYTLKITTEGTYTIRYYCAETEDLGGNAFNSYGTITCLKASDSVENDGYIQGLWSRATTLEAGNTWNVSAVVGLIAEGQARRSFLAYSERERAVPWRAFPIYNSWYELNINRNNASAPENNMQTAQAESVLEAWKTQLFDAQGVGIMSFVWDDGWDNYQTWECHDNFDFTTPSATAKEMGAGTGAWLGPVGGYGVSGDTRRSYWSTRGGMELSNPDYYEVFKNAASQIITNYNGNYFKFDGISAQYSAVGPDTDDTGEEDAEGIISLERDIRSLKADVFLNTSVGTWASPFWYQFTDATWRQESDYGEIGNNSIDRENWITFRDRLVYQNYVQNSPLCPINTLMTHGFILTQYGINSGYGSSYDNGTSEDITYSAVLRELRCAFACGSGMVELYCDHYLMSNIADNNGNKGALWADLAECITWQRNNADVLPDIHWVGGDPYDGSNHNIYGWASWNGKKATLALRNGSNSEMTFTTTLREALEIPDYITGVSITLSKSFSHSQDDLSGLATGTAIDIDTELTMTLPASSVYVFDGVQSEEEKEEPLSVTRAISITAENKYSTCILPFAASIPSGVEVYECASVDGECLVLSQAYSIAANTPYILYAPEGADATLTGTVEDKSVDEVTKGLLTGYALNEHTITLGDNSYVMQNQGDGVMFYNAGGVELKIPAGKCYLTVPESNVKAYRIRRETGIDFEEAEEGELFIYNLMGQRVYQMQPGKIYIVNGRKMIKD